MNRETSHPKVTTLPVRNVSDDDLWPVGTEVEHATLGTGTVTGHSHKGGNPVVVVDFGGALGTKQFIARYAPLSRVEQGGPKVLTEDQDHFDAEVLEAMRRLEVQQAAREVLRARAEPITRTLSAERILDRDQLNSMPAPTPLIDGTLDTSTVAVLGGYWGTCKSFVAQHWAASIATGTHWQGRRAHARKVLYIAAEGAHGLGDRLDAWEAGWRHTIDANTLHALPLAVQLGRRGDVDELARLVDAGEYGFVVVDTLAKCMVGLDENSARDVGLVVDALYRIKDATEAGTVLGVHHTGKDKQTIRGSSALEGGVDCVYQTEGDAYNLRLTRTKRKEGPVDDVHHLRLAPVIGTKSAVLEASGGVGISDAAERVSSHFVSHFKATGASRATLKNSVEMPTSSFYRAVNDLVSRGVLVNKGSETRPFYAWGGADDE